MGSTLTNTQPKDTYKSLLKTSDSTELSATAKYVSDGNGNDSPLALSTSNVGIGTSSPATKLEVFGTGNTLRLDSAANGAKEILFRNVGTQTATIRTDGDLKFETEDSGKFISFFTNSGSGSTERVRIQAAGGISFNGDTAAANALDDYEEGTWTPRVFQGATEFTSPNINSASYTKIGRMVVVNFYFYKSSGAPSATGTITVEGLPFTPSGSNAYYSNSIGYYNINGANASQTTPHRLQWNGGAQLNLYGNNSTTSWISSHFELGGTVTYFV